MCLLTDEFLAHKHHVWEASAAREGHHRHSFRLSMWNVAESNPLLGFWICGGLGAGVMAKRCSTRAVIQIFVTGALHVLAQFWTQRKRRDVPLGAIVLPVTRAG